MEALPGSGIRLRNAGILTPDRQRTGILRNVEASILDKLQDLKQQVMKTDLNWSMCRMSNAKE